MIAQVGSEREAKGKKGGERVKLGKVGKKEEKALRR